MTSNIQRSLSPEKKELDRKRRELSKSQTELTEKELELTSFQAELYFFERHYYFCVARHYIELDELKAKIAETLSNLNPEDPLLKLQAQIAHSKAEESKTDPKNIQFSQEIDSDFECSEDLKKLYRKAVIMIHPDLTTDEVEKLIRHKMLVEINHAYEQGNQLKILQILEQIINNSEIVPEDIEEEDIATELINVIRQIAQVQERLEEIEGELEQLKFSPIYHLKQQALEYENKGDDLLGEMAAEINEELRKAEQELNKLLKKLQERDENL